MGSEICIRDRIYVKPFVNGQKNDYNDAEAIAEAALRPNLRTVREKSQEQLDLQACHWVRSRVCLLYTFDAADDLLRVHSGGPRILNNKTPRQTVSTLAAPFAMSLPAIMKHLDVLSDAGLVARTKSGRAVTCELRAAPMESAMEWLNRYQKFWSEQLDRLSAFLEEEPCSPNPALPSSAASKRPRKKSSKPSRTQRN